MESTEQLVKRFSEKTAELLKCFDDENYDRLQLLLDDRQQIINTFNENPEVYKKGQIALLLRNTDIADLDKKVELIIKSNMEDIKEKLQAIDNKGFINKKYNNGFSGNPLFFNKKIY